MSRLPTLSGRELVSILQALDTRLCGSAVVTCGYATRLIRPENRQPCPTIVS